MKEEEPDEVDLNNNPVSLNTTASVDPNSFVDYRQPFHHESPPPKYFDPEILLNPLPSAKVDILKGLVEPPFGGLVCTDQDAMERQKGVLVDVVKQLAITLLKGLTLAHISLPIKIFEPRSSIQRIVDIWSFAPKFLKQAAETTDHLERLKQVIAFSLSSLYICTSQYKPFNPILG